MPPLRRHQLAWLSHGAWRDILAQDRPADLGRCLVHWRDHQLPMVVTRQPAVRPAPDAPLHLGLPTPPRWGRQLASAAVPPDGILWFDEFPPLAQALAVLPRPARPALQGLDVRLRALDVRARAYGSVGWQCVTGLSYLHEHSDIDLWLPVTDALHADHVAATLQACEAEMRIDGEITFPDGRAVAWREWQAGRLRRCGRVLVKRLDGVALEDVCGDADRAWACAA